ncbi:response regulator transcription factor [Tsukamurella sp. 8F]|uniref:LuxR C-terminal-related transcriptional regulator n=1 Tax=unclassified Tsukamurella TaxID=2633480 RepID=UPI0023B94F31|nr:MULTISPECIES: response regulator transcription factor [unclassified Tsukamurella]MDF0528811.1 response regulator transcription factor [Tsukamurella sp. 8J]MDF0586646.1 response regulator transcription factor [Tsukamurella sp. 8F]
MRIVLGEDSHLLRAGLAAMFTAQGWDVVAQAGSGPELLTAMLDHRPDLSIVDVRMPPSFTDEGLRAALRARAEVPGLPVMVLSQYVEQLYARELLADASGAIGYLLKDRVTDVTRFIDAARQVASGGTVLDPTVVSRIVGGQAPGGRLASLTAREREVLEYMAQGHSNAAIGRELFITEKSVAKHTNSIFAKLGLQDSSDSNRRVRAVLAFLQR